MDTNMLSTADAIAILWMCDDPFVYSFALASPLVGTGRGLDKLMAAAVLVDHLGAHGS